MANGVLVAQNRRPVQTPKAEAAPSALRGTVQCVEFTPDDFELAATAPEVQIATLSKPRFPEWGSRRVGVTDGRLDLPGDMIRMAVTNRYGAGTPVRVAFLENWGTWRGAFATTVSHDSHNLTVFGRDAGDMALAANSVRASGGGLCVVSDGKVRAELALPLAGLVSEAPLDEVAAAFATLRGALDDLVDWQSPYLVLKALFGASLVCNAGPRLSDVGLVDVFEGRVLETPVME